MKNQEKHTGTPAAKKVFVGMSGGVDSSVSAALLVRDGYDVTGVFIKVWQPDRDISGLKCTWREDRLDAMRVAAKLNIKFITLDLEAEYKREVVDYMIAEYRAGRTPNPDVMCNKYVKFGGFFDWAMAQGGDYVATGHYAQILPSASAPNTYDLVAGDDPNKDQTYFLWTLSQEQLSKTLFPVGGIEKPKVRELARSFGLSTAEKKDSQGLCFIGKIDVKEFLSHYIEPKIGEVIDKTGKVIGTHDGAFFFTLGERHGFSIDAAHKTPNDEPYYIVAKNIEKNMITVAHKTIEKTDDTMAEHEVLPYGRTDAHITKVNWPGGNGASYAGKRLLARARYRAPLVPIMIMRIEPKQATCEIKFSEPQYSLSPGQSLVMYDGAVVAGGGIIT
jgi:tRNA-specific 2-thiouridylase